MARVVGVTPDQLRDAGRQDAGDELEQMQTFYVKSVGEIEPGEQDILNARIPDRTKKILLSVYRNLPPVDSPEPERHYPGQSAS